MHTDSAPVHSDLVPVPCDLAPVHTDFAPVSLRRLFGKEVEGTVNVDPEKLEVFMGKMIGHMTGSTPCYSIWPGRRTRAIAALALGISPSTADHHWVFARARLRRELGVGRETKGT